MRAVCNRVNSGVMSYTLEDIASYKDYYPLLEAELFDVVMVDYKGHKLSVFVDDEGMFKTGNFGRLIAGYPQPIFGSIVIVGDVDKNGDTLPLPEELSLMDMMDFSSEVQWRTK